jgi:hypothetical protein
MKRMLYLRVALSKSRPTTNSAGNTKWNVRNLMANLSSHQRWIDLPANLKASDCYSLVVGSSEERPACLRRLPAVRCCANPKKVTYVECGRQSTHSLRKMSTFGFGNICPKKIWTILPQKVDKMSHFQWAESSISDMDL